MKNIRRISALLTISLLCALAVYAAIAYNTGGNNGAITASPANPFNATVTCASTEVCVATMRNVATSFSVTSCTDSASNTWTVGPSVSFGINSVETACYCYGTCVISAGTLHFNYSGTAAYGIIWYDRFTGAATTSPFDTSATATCTATCTTGTITPAGTGEVAYGVASCESTSGSWGPGSGFTTAQATPGSNGLAAYSMYELSWSAGTASATATGGGGVGCGLLVMLFKAAASGTPVRRRAMVIQR